MLLGLARQIMVIFKFTTIQNKTSPNRWNRKNDKEIKILKIE